VRSSQPPPPDPRFGGPARKADPPPRAPVLTSEKAQSRPTAIPRRKGTHARPRATMPEGGEVRRTAKRAVERREKTEHRSR
jgi:hypothetical protein